MMAAEQITITKSLNDLLADFSAVDASVDVSGIAIDSRQVKAGDLFMAYRGAHVNGIDYIDDAIQSGAVAIAIDEDEDINLNSISVMAVKVPNLRQQAGLIISRFFDEPSKAVQVIGVTGTNGKTTVSYMIAYALYVLGKQTAVIGTLGYGRFRQIESGTTTTPDPVTLHSLFSSWRDDVDSVAMEVSSHALDQGRVTGTAFDIAVFTNLSRDHLDYHKTLENYAEVKFQLFESHGLKHAIINADDDYGVQLIDSLPAALNIVAYSTKSTRPELDNKDVDLVHCEKSEIDGLKTVLTVQSPWGQATIKTSLLGDFNSENILAVFSTLCVSGFAVEKVAATLSGFTGIPGRMEYFATKGKPLVVVDYAHTPDALEKALSTLRTYCTGKLYCVFGCGGDRDVGKRPQMGAIAESLSDQVVLSNDNPRAESQEKIVEDILAGVKDKSQITIKYDRSDAITNTFLNANKDDVILIAGKVTRQHNSLARLYYHLVIENWQDA